MNEAFAQKTDTIRRRLQAHECDSAVLEAVVLLEDGLREILAARRHETDSVEDAIRAVGGGTPLEDLGLGKLVGVLGRSGLVDLLAGGSQIKLARLRVLDLNYLNSLRTKFAHDLRKIGPEDAGAVVAAVETIFEVFGLLPTHHRAPEVVQPSLSALLRARLRELRSVIEEEPFLSEIALEGAIRETLAGREQLIGPIRSHFLEVLRAARRRDDEPTGSAVNRAISQFLDLMRQAHERIASEGSALLASIGGGLVEDVVLADYSTPVFEVLRALAMGRPERRKSVRVHLIAANANFLSPQDTTGWTSRLTNDGDCERFFHLEPVTVFEEVPQLAMRLTSEARRAVLLVGAERIYGDATVLVWPGVAMLADLFRENECPVVVAAETYKVIPRLASEMPRFGTDTAGVGLELGVLTMGPNLVLVTDHRVHSKSREESREQAARELPRTSSRVDCCRAFWLSRLSGRSSPLGVIFDFDGTILDSEETHFRLYSEVAARVGIELPRERYFGELQGRTDEDTVAAILGCSPDDPRVGELSEWKAVRYRAELESGAIRATAGVQSYLERLRQDGLLLAVATSATEPEVREGLRILGLSQLFPIVVSAEAPAVRHGKPAPDIFLFAAAKLGLRPEECLVYEDSGPGIEGASRAGMKVVAVRKENQPRVENECVVEFIRDFCEHQLPRL